MSTHDDHWFPAKRLGWGWGLPIRWQGWAVLVGWFAMLLTGLNADDFVPLQLHTLHRVMFIVAMSLLLLFVYWRKGEPARWRWGSP